MRGSRGMADFERGLQMRIRAAVMVLAGTAAGLLLLLWGAPADAQVTSTHIVVQKDGNPTSMPEPGGDAQFTVRVSNGSGVDVNLIALDDDKFGNLDGKGTCQVPQVLTAGGGSYTCTFTGAVSGTPTTPHVNTVTATGEIPGVITDRVSDDATVTFTDVKPQIAIDKSVDKGTIRVGDTVTYTYLVTNPGPEPLQNVTVTDDKCSNVVFGSGDTDGDKLLDNGETWRYTCTTALSADTTNTATATGSDDDGNTVSATDTAKVVVIDPKIAIVKTASPTSANPGQALTYSYAVTNPGNDPLSNVTVTDDKCSPVTFVSGDTDGDSKLDPGETWTFRCATTASASAGALTNIGTATGTDTLGGPVTANDTETVTVVLAAEITPAPQPAPPPAPAQPAAPVAVSGQELPRTGVTALGQAALGGSVVTLGAILLLVTSRRRPARGVRRA